MKQTIVLTPRKITPSLLRMLARRGLVRPLLPTKKVLNTRTKTGAVDTCYRGRPAYGTHKVIAVGKRTLRVKLYTHPDNEDFLLINPTKKIYKPLYIVIARDKRPVFERKARAGILTPRDFFVGEWTFNDPRTCAFTMLRDTVHCEITVPGPGQHPVFFVTEPSHLPSNYVSIYARELVIGSTQESA